ncbi:MAG: hypothetical protein ACXABK_02455 [Candidatus Heimdallarchaeaceae archaeon]|jgi:cation transport ATPase
MSEEFVRCPNCGNLNIKGTTKCVFCDTEISEITETVPEEVVDRKDIPGLPEIPGIPPVPEVKEEGEEVALPKVPEVKEEKPKKKPKDEKIAEIKQTERMNYSIIRKFLLITLFVLLVSAIHYGLNFLVSFLSIDISNPNFDLFASFPATLGNFIEVNAVSFILGIPIAIIVGYFIGKISRTYSANKKAANAWISYAILFDVIINVGLSVALFFVIDSITNAEADIILTYIAGAAVIFLLVNVFSLFIPVITGSHLVYTWIDKKFFARQYAE